MPIAIIAFLSSMSPRWHLTSFTIGPMYHEADAAFWEAALRDFPKLPHLTKVKIIYHYRTHGAFNTSCWDRFDSILSDRSICPLLERIDTCPTIRSQRMGVRNIAIVCGAFSTFRSSGRRPTHWGSPSEPTSPSCPIGNKTHLFLENSDWYSRY